MAAGGELDGVQLLSDKTIARAIEPQNNRPDLILGFPMQWRLGYHGVLTSAAVLGARVRSQRVRRIRRVG